MSDELSFYDHAVLDQDRPKSRGECVDAERPCPWVGCRHHLYLETNAITGAIKLIYPDLEPWDLEESCSLDVADRGGVTLEVVGGLLRLTRERARQIEAKAAFRARALAMSHGIEEKDSYFAHAGSNESIDTPEGG